MPNLERQARIEALKQQGAALLEQHGKSPSLPKNAGILGRMKHALTYPFSPSKQLKGAALVDQETWIMIRVDNRNTRIGSAGNDEPLNIAVTEGGVTREVRFDSFSPDGRVFRHNTSYPARNRYVNSRDLDRFETGIASLAARQTTRTGR